MYLILLGFLIAPWLRWDGRQALLFDVIEPKFYIFGATFMPQDFTSLHLCLSLPL